MRRKLTQPDMPESAIESGFVDFILSPVEIAHEMVRIAHAVTWKSDSVIRNAQQPLWAKLAAARSRLIVGYFRISRSFHRFAASAGWSRLAGGGQLPFTAA